MAKSRNITASVRQRLLNQAKESGRPFMELMQYYAMEGFLNRMSKSPYADRFVLKGALLLRVMGVSELRPTRDIDLLGLSDSDQSTLEQTMRECCTITVPEDGLEFDPYTVQSREIREQQSYPGFRITFQGSLGSAKISMQIDIGYGDVVSPCPLWVEYPVLLDGTPPKLMAYTLESAVAEKFHAMVFLDLANSRMKDFYDIWYISQFHSCHASELRDAIRHTFKRRNTELPDKLPTVFTDDFSKHSAKKTQWKAFHKNLADSTCPEHLSDVVMRIQDFIWPSLRTTEIMKWKPESGWVN